MENKVKYPRTYHFFNSPNLQNDDRRLENYNGFYNNPPKRVKCPSCEGGRYMSIMGCSPPCSNGYIWSKPSSPKEVIGTLKLDGENTTMYNDHIHARSLDSKHHESRTIVKQIHGKIRHLIPKGMRVCGENMQACHSIYYTGLPSYFMIFNIWQDNTCLSWEETSMWVEEFRTLSDVCLAPVFYTGLFNIDDITRSFQNYKDHEGFVVRDQNCFNTIDFSTHCGKFVRKGHVQTSEHWMNEQIIPNRLRENNEEIRCWTRSEFFEGLTKKIKLCSIDK